ncbi:alpha/beta hydrolase [Listeria sp. PSOL-1]|uniref:alpha/beta hydrolase n=1 Tax=Listeria sp. PSOL-1 TaxID=1844999 RepID=UPI0013CF8EB1|nr:alpha/beta hydrolase [Listeria sp. PSOL-1]
MRKIALIVVPTVTMFILIAVIIILHNDEEKEDAKLKRTIIPTVFVHGYKGTFNSFGNMLNRFSKQEGSRTIAMRISVSQKGTLMVRGNLDPDQKGDSAIQVIFEDNRASLARQTLWMQNVMQYLRKKEEIKKINLVGHSMGGLAILNYLETTKLDHHYPTPQKFIAIATPFNGINKADYFKLQKDPAAHDLKTGSSALKLLQQKKRNIPKNIKMLAIAGEHSGLDSDGLVQVKSVFFAKNFFPKEAYQERLVKGPDITHSGLHENNQVDQYVSQFLWNLPEKSKSKAAI